MQAPNRAKPECKTPQYRPNKHAREPHRHPRLAHELRRGKRSQQRDGKRRRYHPCIPLRLELAQLSLPRSSRTESYLHDASPSLGLTARGYCNPEGMSLYVRGRLHWQWRAAFPPHAFSTSFSGRVLLWVMWFEGLSRGSSEGSARFRASAVKLGQL